MRIEKDNAVKMMLQSLEMFGSMQSCAIDSEENLSAGVSELYTHKQERPEVQTWQRRDEVETQEDMKRESFTRDGN